MSFSESLGKCCSFRSIRRFFSSRHPEPSARDTEISVELVTMEPDDTQTISTEDGLQQHLIWATPAQVHAAETVLQHLQFSDGGHPYYLKALEPLCKAIKTQDPGALSSAHRSLNQDMFRKWNYGLPHTSDVAPLRSAVTKLRFWYNVTAHCLPMWTEHRPSTPRASLAPTGPSSPPDPTSSLLNIPSSLRSDPRFVPGPGSAPNDPGSLPGPSSVADGPSLERVRIQTKRDKELERVSEILKRWT